MYDFLMKSPSFQVASKMIVARFSLKYVRPKVVGVAEDVCIDLKFL